jgi:hypothetical protein
MACELGPKSIASLREIAEMDDIQSRSRARDLSYRPVQGNLVVKRRRPPDHAVAADHGRLDRLPGGDVDRVQCSSRKSFRLSTGCNPGLVEAGAKAARTQGGTACKRRGREWLLQNLLSGNFAALRVFHRAIRPGRSSAGASLGAPRPARHHPRRYGFGVVKSCSLRALSQSDHRGPNVIRSHISSSILPLAKQNRVEREHAR